MLTLDSSSAGVIAGVFSALLIALAIHRPGAPRADTPEWIQGMIIGFELTRILAVFCAATSIYLCLMIVGGGQVVHSVEVFVSITMGLLLFAANSWIADYAGPSLRRLLRGES